MKPDEIITRAESLMILVDDRTINEIALLIQALAQLQKDSRPMGFIVPSQFGGYEPINPPQKKDC